MVEVNGLCSCLQPKTFIATQCHHIYWNFSCHLRHSWFLSNFLANQCPTAKGVMVPLSTIMVLTSQCRMQISKKGVKKPSVLSGLEGTE